MYEDFKELGVDVACPVAEEYKCLFLKSKGDYNNIVTAYITARALNPLVAATMSDEGLVDLSSADFDLPPCRISLMKSQSIML